MWRKATRGGRALVLEGRSWRRDALRGGGMPSVAEGRPPWWRDALRGGGMRTDSVAEGQTSWRRDGLRGGGTDFVAEGRTP